MQEFKGTKGIWHCDDYGHIEDKDCRPIGGVFINRRLAFEWEANAQLIAAAPEMLQRLKSVQLMLMAHPDYVVNENQEFIDQVDSIEEVVAKALNKQ